MKLKLYENFNKVNAIKDCIESSLYDIGIDSIKYSESSYSVVASITYEVESVDKFKSDMLSMSNKLIASEFKTTVQISQKHIRIANFMEDDNEEIFSPLTNDICILIFTKGLLANRIYTEDTYRGNKKGDEVIRNNSIRIDQLVGKKILIRLSIPYNTNHKYNEAYSTTDSKNIEMFKDILESTLDEDVYSVNIVNTAKAAITFKYSDVVDFKSDMISINKKLSMLGDAEPKVVLQVWQENQFMYVSQFTLRTLDKFIQDIDSIFKIYRPGDINNSIAGKRLKLIIYI